MKPVAADSRDPATEFRRRRYHNGYESTLLLSQTSSQSSWQEKTPPAPVMDVGSTPLLPVHRQLQKSSTGSPRWLTLAIASGAFAAFNGVFAKLTTTSQTHGLATWISRLFGFSESTTFVELLLRVFFFILNLASNATMWVLFTRALTAASSTTRVAILNTSSNFVVTAVLGMAVFSEGLPLMWWAGAALLVAGSVVIGAREGQEHSNNDRDFGRDYEPAGEMAESLLGGAQAHRTVLETLENDGRRVQEIDKGSLELDIDNCLVEVNREWPNQG